MSKKVRRSKRLEEKNKLENKNEQTSKSEDKPEKKKQKKDFINNKDSEKNKEIIVFFLNQLNNSVSEEKTEEVEEKEIEEENIFGPFLPEKDEMTFKTIKFTKIFESLDELVELGENYDPSVINICNINMRKLHRMTEHLKELKTMIGLERFKKNILDQLIYILTTDFTDRKEIPMLHTCIYGGPGTGKTTCAEILGKIYASCGILSKGIFKIAKREDFVGEFLGSTSLKTKALLNSCKGGVLFIDEVYSFGNPESKRDSFAKEAVDAINVFLSENYKDFICIIAGYKEQINKCFFSQNEGLRRRFTNTYTMESYSAAELSEIFLKFVKDEAWSCKIEKNVLHEFFNDHKESFPYYGGDVKTLLDKCKIIHSRKVVILEKHLWKTLSQGDVEEGFLLYLEERQEKKEEPPHLSMYI